MLMNHQLVFRKLILISLLLIGTPALMFYAPAQGHPPFQSKPTTQATVVQTDLERITPANARRLTQLARLGRGSVQQVAWSRDGKTLAVSGTLGVWLYNVTALEARPRLLESPDECYGIAFSPDGSLLASGCGSRIRLWDLKAGRIHMTLDSPTAATQIAFSPDGKHLASGGGYSNGLRLEFPPAFLVRLWNLESGKEQTTLEGEVSSTALAFNSDGKLLFAIADSGQLHAWDVRTGKSLAFFREHLGPVRGVAFSPDGRALAHGGDDNSARLWNVRTGVQSSVLQGPSRHGFGAIPMVMGVAFSPDGKTLASSSFQSMVRLWDLQTGKLAASLKWLEDFAHPINHPHSGNVAFSPNGTLLAAVYEDGKMRLWNVLTRQQQAVFQSGSDVLWGLAFSPDGNLLAFSGGSTDIAGAAYLWDVKTAQELAVLNATSKRIVTYAVAFSPDGRLLAAGNSGGTIQLWDAKNRQIRITLKSHKASGGGIAFSPDGRLFVSGGDDGSLIVWDVATGEEQFVFTDLRVPSFFNQINEIVSVAFNPDGTLIAVGGSDGTIRLWGVRAGS